MYCNTLNAPTGHCVICMRGISFLPRQKRWHHRSHLMRALNIRRGHSIQEFSTSIWAPFALPGFLSAHWEPELDGTGRPHISIINNRNHHSNTFSGWRQSRPVTSGPQPQQFLCSTPCYSLDSSFCTTQRINSTHCVNKPPQLRHN